MSIHGKGVLKILLALVVGSSIVLGAGVKLRLNSTEVVEGSALEVQLIAEGKDVKFPSIKDVGGFPTEGNTVSSKLESTYINGTFSSKSLKTLRFTFYPETDMTIPAFKVTIHGKSYQTKPVKIRVIKPSAVTAQSVDGYTLRISANKKHLFVGEPMIVTVDFFEPRNSAVTKVEYTPPKFKSFFSQSLGDEKLKRSAAGTLHQLQYLVSAKKEGSLTIMPPKARVGVRSVSGQDRDPWGFFANDVTWHSVRAAPLTVRVKPVPANVDLIGLFKVESRVDHTQVKPNAPVTYTLKISGEGSLDDLADPKFDVPGVTVYGDDAKVTSKVIGDKVVSQYERKYVFISDRSFTIPSLSFRSFDYLSRQRKKLLTKAHQITVTGGTITTSPTAASVQKKQPQAPLQTKVTKGMSKQNKSVLEDVLYYKKKEAEDRQGYPLWIALLGFALGAVSILFGQKVLGYLSHRKKGRRIGHYSTEEALKILYPHTNLDKKVEAMVRKLYEQQHDRKISVDRKELDRLVNIVLEQKRAL